MVVAQWSPPTFGRSSATASSDAAFEFLDQNVGLVIGAEAVLLIDTLSHPGHARRVLSDPRLVTPLPVGWCSHPLSGDHHVRKPGLRGIGKSWGHVKCRSELMERGLTHRRTLVTIRKKPTGFRKVVVTPPTEVFDERATIDLGTPRG